MSAVDVFKVLSSVCSVCLGLSPIPSIYRRYKAQDTGEYQILPLLVMIGNYLLWSIYGLFVGDVFPLATTSGINSMLGLSYSIMFILSTRDRAKAVKKFIIGISVTALFVLYALLAWTGVTNQSIANTGDVLGYIVVVTTLMFYLSPLAKLRRVLRTKSAATIPIATSCMALLNNSLWLVYALLIHDHFILVPNVVCVIFGSLQVGLYIKYRPSRDDLGKTDGGDRDEIVVVSVVRISANEKHSATTCGSPSFQAIVSPLSPVVDDNSSKA